MSGAKDLLAARKLVSWVNTTLDTNLLVIEELCSGAAYCQLLHKLHPQAVPINRIFFVTDLLTHFRCNFKVLHNSFAKLGIDFKMPPKQLMCGEFAANFSFAKRFYSYYKKELLSRQEADPAAYRACEERAYSKIMIATPTLEVTNRGNQTLDLQFDNQRQMMDELMELKKEQEVYERKLETLKLMVSCKASPSVFNQVVRDIVYCQT